MSTKKQYQSLIKALGSERVQVDEPLAAYTTFRLGGPSDLFFTAKSTPELVGAVSAAKEFAVDYLVLGRGSNLLISDEGYRGVVIKNDSSTGEALETNPLRVDSGYSLQQLIDFSFDKGLVGLELFGGIPASVGGAVYNNVHGKDQFFNDRVQKVTLLTKDGIVRPEPVSYLQSSYDYTILQETGEVVLDVTLKLERGDVEEARILRAAWWQEKKKFQPQTNCAGCIFKNISKEDQQRLGYPTPSVGYLIDKGLGLKNAEIGGAKVCETHANFIVNTGAATAEDVWLLIRKIQDEAKEKLEVNLELEVELVGNF